MKIDVKKAHLVLERTVVIVELDPEWSDLFGAKVPVERWECGYRLDGPVANVVFGEDGECRTALRPAERKAVARRLSELGIAVER